MRGSLSTARLILPVLVLLDGCKPPPEDRHHMPTADAAAGRAFVRDAPALVPGTAMPAMPISEEESRDVAAYLYSLERD